MTILFLIGFILLVVGIDYYRGSRRKRAIEGNPFTDKKDYQLKKDLIHIPQGLYHGWSHTWAYLTESGTVRIGLDDLLKHVVGKIDDIDLPNHNESITRGELLCTISQNGKQLRIASPISGRIQFLNSEIVEHPSFALSNPHNSRWIMEIEPHRWMDEIRELKIGKKATNWMGDEVARLKDFFATSYLQTCEAECNPTLQEGGEIAEKVLQYSNDDLWHEFQTGFLGEPRLKNQS